MKRGAGAISRAVATLLVAASLVAPLAAAKPKRDLALEAQLRAHIAELASDAYEGREPGTDGEALTLRYLGKQWFDMGLASGTNDPGNAWFAPVTLIGREPDAGRATFTRKGRRVYVPVDAVAVFTPSKRGLIEPSPVLFVGTGEVVPPRAELGGRIALLLDGGREDSERQNALLAGGATAVLTLLDGERTLENVIGRRQRASYALADDEPADEVEGFITVEGLTRALAGTGQNPAGLKAAALAAGFTPRLLDLSASLEATSRETRIKTHNLIGKIPGRKPDGGAVLLLAHWDHFGKCVSPPAEDLICNGAIDNASGVAVLTEIARRLARGPVPDRDIYFLASTAEELGLLGVRAFADNPPVPLNQIVAAFNIDSVAVAPPGAPLAIVGKGLTPLDPQIAAVARAQKRKLVEGDPAASYVRRQDGWALLQHDVPAVMVTSAWSDQKRIEAFMEGDYHRPSDQLRPDLELGGAAEDVAFHVAMVRWFATPKRVPLTAK